MDPQSQAAVFSNTVQGQRCLLQNLHVTVTHPAFTINKKLSK